MKQRDPSQSTQKMYHQTGYGRRRPERKKRDVQGSARAEGAAAAARTIASRCMLVWSILVAELSLANGDAPNTGRTGPEKTRKTLTCVVRCCDEQ